MERPTNLHSLRHFNQLQLPPIISPPPPSARPGFTLENFASYGGKEYENRLNSGYPKIPLPIFHEKKCNQCKGPILETQKYISFNDKLLHSTCFVCSTCFCVLDGKYQQKDGQVYCAKDFAKVVETMKTNEIPQDLDIRFSSQPAHYQIANYNVFPSIIISIDRVLSSEHTLYINLVESVSKELINTGFVSGDVRLLRPGASKVKLSGLKLNKMGPIKAELQSKRAKMSNSEFRVRIKLGSKSIYSNPFKLFSSCSQLPEEVRGDVRPTKKSGSRKKRDKDGSGSESDEGLSSQENPSPNEISSPNATSPKPSRTISNQPSPQTVAPVSTNSPNRTNTIEDAIVLLKQQTQQISMKEQLRNDLETAIIRGDSDSAAKAASQLASLNRTQGSVSWQMELQRKGLIV